MRKLCIILFILMGFGSVGFAQKDYFENRIEKHFDADEIKNLQLHNMFGNINVKPADANSIDILIVISAENADTKRNRAFLNEVKIDISQNGNTLTLETEKFDKGTSFWEKLKNFSIDYTIYMPVRTNLSIQSKFGDIKIDEISGTLDIDTQHGDVFIGRAGSVNNNLNIKFGDIRLDDVNQLQLNAQHGDLTVGRANDVAIDIKFGDSKIDELGGDSQIQSKHGDLTIKKLSNIENLDIDVQFSDLEIDDFGKVAYQLNLSGNFIDYSWDKNWLVRSQSSGTNSYSFILETPNSSGILRTITITAEHSDIELD